jgi:hypothetical protein
MAKTLRTSQNYTIQAGDGASGSHTITLDSNDVIVTGDLIIQGDQTTINTETLTIEDQFIEIAKNSSVGDQDAGIFFYRGTSDNPGILFYDASDDTFKLGWTNNSPTVSEINNLVLKNLQVAEPSNNSDVATKYYVDSSISAGSMSSFIISDGTGLSTQTIGDTDIITFADGRNTSSEIVSTDTVKINLDNDLIDVNSITAQTGNTLSLSVDTNYNVVINSILSFGTNLSSDPAGTSTVTRLYAKTPAGGGTGLFFKNDNVNSGSADELISKKKATAIAIALG